jgi:hypothetical protein
VEEPFHESKDLASIDDGSGLTKNRTGLEVGSFSFLFVFLVGLAEEIQESEHIGQVF